MRDGATLQGHTLGSVARITNIVRDSRRSRRCATMVSYIASYPDTNSGTPSGSGLAKSGLRKYLGRGEGQRASVGGSATITTPSLAAVGVAD